VRHVSSHDRRVLYLRDRRNISSSHYARDTMNIKTLASTFAVMSIALSPAALAADFSYSYVEAGIALLDIDGEDGKGFALGGSAEVGENVAVFASYATATSDDEYLFNGNIDEIEVSGYTIGLSFHTPVSDTTDFVGSIGFGNSEAEFAGATADADTKSLTAGVRSMVSSSLELSGGLVHVRGEGESDTGFGVAARTGINENLSAIFSFESFDDVDVIGLSLRVDLK
jgi:hypothetical protein